MADAPFGKWHTQTFVAGRRCDRLVAPWIVDGVMAGLFDPQQRRNHIKEAGYVSE